MPGSICRATPRSSRRSPASSFERKKEMKKTKQRETKKTRYFVNRRGGSRLPFFILLPAFVFSVVFYNGRRSLSVGWSRRRVGGKRKTKRVKKREKKKRKEEVEVEDRFDRSLSLFLYPLISPQFLSSSLSLFSLKLSSFRPPSAFSSSPAQSLSSWPSRGGTAWPWGCARRRRS